MFVVLRFNCLLCCLCSFVIVVIVCEIGCLYVVLVNNLRVWWLILV